MFTNFSASLYFISDENENENERFLLLILLQSWWSFTLLLALCQRDKEAKLIYDISSTSAHIEVNREKHTQANFLSLSRQFPLHLALSRVVVSWTSASVSVLAELLIDARR